MLSGFDLRLFGRILNIGVPAMAERYLLHQGGSLSPRQVAGLGTEACPHSPLNVESFSYMPGMGFTTSATASWARDWGERSEGAERAAIICNEMGAYSPWAMGSSSSYFRPDS